jgi:hypothetical protein
MGIRYVIYLKSIHTFDVLVFLGSLMSKNSPLGGTVGLGPQESYNPYLPYATYSTNEVQLAHPDTTLPTGFTPSARPRKSRFESLAHVYDAISWIFGFKEKYSLALCAYKVSIPYLQLIPTVYSNLFRRCSHRILSCAKHNDEPGKCPGPDHFWSVVSTTLYFQTVLRYLCHY